MCGAAGGRFHPPGPTLFHGGEEETRAVGPAWGMFDPMAPPAPRFHAGPPEMHDASPFGASLPHCHAPSGLRFPRCPSWGVQPHMFSLGCLGVCSAQQGMGLPALLLCSLAWVHTIRVEESGPHDARDSHIAILRAICPQIKSATVLLPASCCPAQGPPASVLSLLASGAAAGQRDAALFPLSVASVDALPAPALVAWGPFKTLRICSTTC